MLITILLIWYISIAITLTFLVSRFVVKHSPSRHISPVSSGYTGLVFGIGWPVVLFCAMVYGFVWGIGKVSNL